MNGPETRQAVLWCLRCKHPTPHTYEGGTRAATSTEEPSPFYRLYFGCKVCGEARTWGTQEDRPADEYRTPAIVTPPVVAA